MMETEINLKRKYLCEIREGSLDPTSLTMAPGHELHLCDYCYRWHVLPVHADEAQILRLAAGMDSMSRIIAAHPARSY
jgi:hypothetical protein